MTTREHLACIKQTRSISNGSRDASRFLAQGPFDTLFGFMAGRGLKPIYNEEYTFDGVPAALAHQDAGAGGKIVIVHG